MRLSSDHFGRVTVVVSDLNGRTVRELSLDKETDTLRTQLLIDDLPAGTYYLRLIEGDRQTIRSFIRM